MSVAGGIDQRTWEEGPAETVRLVTSMRRPSDVKRPPGRPAAVLLFFVRCPLDLTSMRTRVSPVGSVLEEVRSGRCHL